LIERVNWTPETSEILDGMRKLCEDTLGTAVAK
jgi:hypothetical protein